MTAKKIDTGTDHLLADIEDGVLTITLNRPEARNAMSRELVLALVDQLKDAQENSDVKCVVLTGAGKGFCAGGDVKAMGAGPGESPPTIDESINRQRYQQRAPWLSQRPLHRYCRSHRPVEQDRCGIGKLAHAV